MILYSSLSNNLGPLLYRVEFKLSLFLSFESIKRPPSNITNINYLPWLFQICARAKSAKFCQHYPYSDCNVCYNNDHLWWYLELIIHNIISIRKIEIEINDTVIAFLNLKYIVLFISIQVRIFLVTMKIVYFKYYRNLFIKS